MGRSGNVEGEQRNNVKFDWSCCCAENEHIFSCKNMFGCSLRGEFAPSRGVLRSLRVGSGQWSDSHGNCVRSVLRWLGGPESTKLKQDENLNTRSSWRSSPNFSIISLLSTPCVAARPVYDFTLHLLTLFDLRSYGWGRIGPARCLSLSECEAALENKYWEIEFMPDSRRASRSSPLRVPYASGGNLFRT